MPTIAAQRLLNQQLEQPRFETPTDVVGWLCAVQAQEYAGAVWSVGLRLPGATEGEIDRAFDDGVILRTHAMRPTWHFVTPGDIRWLLDLTAPRVHAANAYWYRKFELDAAIFTRSEAVLRAELGGTQRTRAELAAALARAGIDAAGLRLSYIMMHAELEQLICSGPRRGKQFTYALLEERVPQARVLVRDEALAELTLRYFASRGPALIEDFVWWSGLTVADARTGLQLARPIIVSEQIDGKTYWCASSTPARTTAMSNGYLLPQYDEFISGYNDHSSIMDPQYVEQARTAAYFNVVLIDGQLAGNWRRTFKGRTVVVEWAPWRPWSAVEHDAVLVAAQRMGAFLGVAVALT